MIAHQIALMKREFWEHRAIWLTPAVIGVVISVAALTGMMSLSNFAEEVDAGIIGASNVQEIPRIAMMAALGGITAVFAMGAGIVQIFYSLDSLYSERKDKSILFWRSLPITDAETVISKMLTVFLVIPAAALLGTFATHLVFMTISSGWLLAEGGNPAHLIWRSAPIFDAWASGILTAYMVTIWLSPFFGWFLFVSAFTKRMPLLMAFLPLIILPLLEIAILPTNFLATAILERLSEIESAGINIEDVADTKTFEAVSMLSAIDLGRFFTSPSVWAGVVVCGLFVTAAIYVRRYKDDS